MPDIVEKQKKPEDFGIVTRGKFSCYTTVNMNNYLDFLNAIDEPDEYEIINTSILSSPGLSSLTNLFVIYKNLK